MLVSAAANQWGVPTAEITTAKGVLTHAKSGKTGGYGEFADAASKLPVPDRDTVKLKDAKDFTFIGKGNVDIVDGRGISTGTAVYGMDHKLPGMLHAVVARCPVFGGTMKSFDDSAALKVPGVVKVVAIAPAQAPVEFPAARRRRGDRQEHLRRHERPRGAQDRVGRGPERLLRFRGFPQDARGRRAQAGKVVRAQGDVDEAMGKAVKKITAEYYVPHLVQAPMESRPRSPMSRPTARSRSGPRSRHRRPPGPTSPSASALVRTRCA